MPKEARAIALLSDVDKKTYNTEGNGWYQIAPEMFQKINLNYKI